MKKKVFISGVLAALCIFTGSIGIKANDEKKENMTMQATVYKMEEVKKNSASYVSTMKVTSNEVVEITCLQGHANCNGVHDVETCPQGHKNCVGMHMSGNGVGKNECPQNHENCNGIHNQGTAVCPQGHENCTGRHANGNGVGKNECPQNHENCNGNHGQGNGNKFQGKRWQN